MTKIHIPPAALEAGWKAVANGNACCRTSEQIARAAFEAMIAAWPGSFEEYMNVEEGRAVVCMILPKGGDDD